MKIFITKLLIGVFLILNIVIVKANYELTYKEKAAINKITQKIENIINENWIEYKQKLINSLEKYKNKTQILSKWYTIFKILIEKTRQINFEKTYLEHYQKYNINFNEIKNQWMIWHNNERKIVWSNLYSIDKRLDTTAYERSTEQTKKGIMEHKRNPWDSYYDYNKIETWFQNRWVKCEVKWWVTSSESIWKFSYYCIDSDCTDELLKSLKVIYNIYLAEKWQPYDAHYRAITHKDLSKIWLWISIKKSSDKNFYDYYVTTHYCTNFIN